MVKDKHLCPICKRQQLYYVDTWLCPKCNWEQIWDLLWDYNIIKGRKNIGE